MATHKSALWRVLAAAFTIRFHGRTGTFHSPVITIVSKNQLHDDAHILFLNRFVRPERIQPCFGFFVLNAIFTPLHGLAGKSADVITAHAAKGIGCSMNLCG